MYTPQCMETFSVKLVPILDENIFHKQQNFYNIDHQHT